MEVIQSELHKIINSFINGNTLTKRAKACSLWKKEHENHFKTIAKILDKDEEINIFFRQTRKALSKVRGKDFMGIDTFIDILITLYSEFYFSKETNNTRNICKSGKKIIVQVPMKYHQWYERANKKEEVITELASLRRKVIEFGGNGIIDLLLIGSYATFDYSDWSDIDMVLIISDDVFKEKDKLKRLHFFILNQQDFFTLCDPLQHHGFFIITESEMKAYPQIYMPFEVYKRGVSFFNMEELTFYERGCEDEIKYSINEIISYIQNINDLVEKQKKISAFEWKAYLSGILLLPCLYLQSRDKPHYKKDALRVVCNYFDEKSCELIKTVTEIRVQWKYKNVKKSFIMYFLFWSSPFLRRYVVKRKIKVPVCVEKKKDILLSQSRHFLEEMKKKSDII